MRLYEVGKANLRKRSATSFPYSCCYVPWRSEATESAAWFESKASGENFRKWASL